MMIQLAEGRSMRPSNLVLAALIMLIGSLSALHVLSAQDDTPGRAKRSFTPAFKGKEILDIPSSLVKAVLEQTPSPASPRQQPDLAANFAIIGFPKCGTTSLIANLAHGRHPEIGLIEREQYLFRNAMGLSMETVDRFNENLPQGIARGFKDPELIYNKEAIQTLLQLNPDMKFIITVRNPTDWMFSYYNYRVSEFLQPAQWLLDHPRWEQIKKTGIIPLADIASGKQQEWLSLQRDHGKMWTVVQKNVLQVVPPNKVLLLHVKDLEDDPRGFMRKVTNFLGVHPFPFDQEFVTANVNPGNADPPACNDSNLSMLSHYYAADTEALRGYFGQSISLARCKLTFRRDM